MDLTSSLILSLIVVLLSSRGSYGSTFTFANRCGFTVWPGILANAGSPTLSTTGFELPKGTSRSLQAPTGWSGRFWARTGCKFDASGSGTCTTGDCGSNQVECVGLGAAPPVTLAEFTLGTGGDDFYDVSLVDGYNIPMIVEVAGGSGQCASTGCTSDLNTQCPAELRFGDGDACKSACEAFRSPEYCCSGAYATPSTCRPSVYSQMFKAACPRSYSYAYDDATSTFTCAGGEYTVTFCPSSPSQKSTSYSPPVSDSSSTSQGSDPVTGSDTVTRVRVNRLKVRMNRLRVRVMGTGLRVVLGRRWVRERPCYRTDHGWLVWPWEIRADQPMLHWQCYSPHSLFRLFSRSIIILAFGSCFVSIALFN